MSTHRTNLVTSQVQTFLADLMVDLDAYVTSEFPDWVSLDAPSRTTIALMTLEERGLALRGGGCNGQPFWSATPLLWSDLKALADECEVERDIDDELLTEEFDDVLAGDELEDELEDEAAEIAESPQATDYPRLAACMPIFRNWYRHSLDDYYEITLLTIGQFWTLMESGLLCRTESKNGTVRWTATPKAIAFANKSRRFFPIFSVLETRGVLTYFDGDAGEKVWTPTAKALEGGFDSGQWTAADFLKKTLPEAVFNKLVGEFSGHPLDEVD
jgi:hypothetical protein